MAKFKKHKRRSTRRKVGATTHRRRRIGATKGLSLKMTATNPLFKIGSIALGFFMPDLLPINKLVGDKMDPKLVAGAEAGLGFLLAMKKGQKSLPLTVIGGYLLGAGIKKGLVSFGIMSGVSPYGRVNVVNGASPYGLLNVVNGMSPNRTIQGMSPNRTINRVMNGTNSAETNSSGSGLMQSNKGSNMMN